MSEWWKVRATASQHLAALSREVAKTTRPLVKREADQGAQELRVLLLVKMWKSKFEAVAAAGNHEVGVAVPMTMRVSVVRRVSTLRSLPHVAERVRVPHGKPIQGVAENQGRATKAAVAAGIDLKLDAVEVGNDRNEAAVEIAHNPRGPEAAVETAGSRN
jgi:hypothetical protein